MSSPITSAIPSSSPITSVAPSSYTSPVSAGAGGNQQLLSRLNLDLRGTVFTVDRETLMLLPESVLLGLFPQGLVLTKQGGWEAEEGVVGVDVSLFLCSSPVLRARTAGGKMGMSEGSI